VIVLSKGPVWYFHKVWFKMKDYDKQLDSDADKEIMPNIYCVCGTRRQYVKLMNRLHRWFKGLCLVPGIWLSKKLLGKALVTEVPNMPHLVNLKVFERSFDESVDDWNKYYRLKGLKGYLRVPKQKLDDYDKRFASTILRDIKSLYLSVMLRDSAYFEFHNILMHKIAQNMFVEHGNNPWHLFYCGQNISDLKYFALRNHVSSIPLCSDCKQNFFRNLRFSNKK